PTAAATGSERSAADPAAAGPRNGSRAEPGHPAWSGTMDVSRTAATSDDSSLSIETMSDDKGNLLSLDVTEITNVLVRPGGLWREIRVVGETGSTNADLLAQAGADAAEGLVLVAEAQTAARGRLGRRWTSPPRAALTFSVLLRPRGVPPALLGWAPLP